MKNRFLKELDDEEDIWLKSSILMDILRRKDAIDIIKEIFYELSSREYFPDIMQYLFDYLICYPTIFKEEIIITLNNLDIKNLHINYNTAEVILYNIPQCFSSFINNLHCMNFDCHKRISLLTKFSLEHQEYFEELLSVVINSHSLDIRHAFIIEIIKEEYDFDFNLILNFFRKLEETNNISSLLCDLAKVCYRNSKLRDFLVNNFSELIKMEKTNKMSFYCDLEKYLPVQIKQKYSYLYQIYINSSVPHNTENMLDILLEHQEEDFIKDYIQDKDISYLSEGTTAQCFKIGDDKVLKISKMKHMKDTITKHFFISTYQYENYL